MRNSVRRCPELLHMGKIGIVLIGEPYDEPRYAGEVSWSARNVYLRHPGGGKDSRHSDGRTLLTSTEASRQSQLRVPTSDVSRELVNFVQLRSGATEPPVLRRPIRPDDLVVGTASVGTAPRFAVEIVASSRAPGVAAAWRATSGVSSAFTYVDKGLGQSIVVAFAGSATTTPSTGAA
jgi:hypothetical protein